MPWLGVCSASNQQVIHSLTHSLTRCTAAPVRAQPHPATMSEWLTVNSVRVARYFTKRENKKNGQTTVLSTVLWKLDLTGSSLFECVTPGIFLMCDTAHELFSLERSFFAAVPTGEYHHRSKKQKKKSGGQNGTARWYFLPVHTGKVPNSNLQTNLLPVLRVLRVRRNGSQHSLTRV